MRKTLWLTGFGLAATALLSTAGPAAAAASVMEHDGPYQVNTEISAGYYTTHTAAPGCEWARFTAGGDIIEQGKGGNGTVTVRIPATDAVFSTSGCGTWTIEGDQRQPTGPSTGSFGSS
ncbi:hypothetical protein [Nocardia crassostreae]|uniref:hypothetical protein n=1 Tax=Nocardia crassostreae TaxID=53428 RepID=UPI000831293A|nr:hypothetical protein [Nocardia crassostreae]